jgi:hypothetical protein
MIVHAPEIIAAGHGSEGAVEGKNFEAVAGEIEFANDFGAEQRDDVGAFGEEEAGDDFFGYGGAAEDVAAFEDENFFAGLGEVRGVDQAVVAAADDDCVVILRHSGRLHTNPKVKVMLETRRVYWDGATAYKGLKRKRRT